MITPRSPEWRANISKALKGRTFTSDHLAHMSAAQIALGRGATATKVCPRCKKELPRSVFPVRSRKGRQYSEAYCPPCRKEKAAETQAARSRTPEQRAARNAKSLEWSRANKERHDATQKARTPIRKYGITVETISSMKAAQDGKCSICQLVPERGLSVDHNHATGTVRELLCHRCNTGLGFFREDPTRLRAAASYIERHAV